MSGSSGELLEQKKPPEPIFPKGKFFTEYIVFGILKYIDCEINGGYMMSYFCTECLEYKEFKEVFKLEEYCIGEQKIEINSRFLECVRCRKLILDPKNIDENFINAYNIYRKRNNLLQPSEIKQIREKYQLTQKQFNDILGLEENNLARYETGALQPNEINELLIKIQKKPELLLEKLRCNPFSLEVQEYIEIEKRLEELCSS